MLMHNITEEEKTTTITKLKQINGRVKGISRMIEEGRPEEDILMQISATHESLRLIARAVIKNSLQKSVTQGLTAINKDKREATYKEVMDIIYKYVK
jgi:CsoR family transcriptional regulator, copper-sensing transcriptional repressor